MKYIFKALLSELKDFFVLASVVSTLVGLGWVIDKIAGEYAIAIVFLIVLVVAEAILIADKVKDIKRNERHENES